MRAEGFPEDAIRARARTGTAAAFPPVEWYGNTLFGATGAGPVDAIDALRLVPPVFMPGRLEKLIELAREPIYSDVVLGTPIGGFRSPLPVYISAFGSTQVASTRSIGCAHQWSEKISASMRPV